MNQVAIGAPVYAAVAALAFLGSYVALCAFRPVAVMVRLLDVTSALKKHQGEVPLVGGLAILAGYALALSMFPVYFAANTVFLIASVIIVIAGALDDRFALSPLVRLTVQLVVTITAVLGAGLTVDNIGAPFFTGVIDTGWLAIPFIVLVFVGSMNGWNMIDGIDGLASVLAFIALSCMLIVGVSATPALQVSLLAMLCGIAPFFLFNLPFRGLRRYRTFLGDAGSTFLGLAVVWHALALSQGEAPIMSPITALWFVVLPVFDVITTTTRRILNRVSPLLGDRQHLHHLLQDYGLSTHQTLAVLSVLALLGGAIGLISHFAGIPDDRVFTLFALLGAAYFYGVQRLAKSMADTDALPIASKLLPQAPR